VAFDTDADTTALAFVTANHDAFDAVGVELTNATNTIVMEAQVSGVPFTAPARVITAGDLTLSIAHTLANVTVDDVTLADMAIDFGGGGEIRNVCVKPMQFNLPARQLLVCCSTIHLLE
jgi:hypothetical protein